MDYAAQLPAASDAIGRYDRAAILVTYGGQRESFDGPADATRGNRTLSRYYAGGEPCARDADCPQSAIGQRCGHWVESDYFERPKWVPEERAPSGRGVCSDWDVAHASDAVPYRSCAEESVPFGNLCDPWDEGPTVQDVVDNAIHAYDRDYVFNNFVSPPAPDAIRRYVRRIWSRYFRLVWKPAIAWLQQYYNDPYVLYDPDTGFELMPGREALAFFNRVVAQPDVGTYVPGDGDAPYYRASPDCEEELSWEDDVLRLCIGAGRYARGRAPSPVAPRLRRIGALVDKWLAVRALTLHPFDLQSGFRIGIYDAFPAEVHGRLSAYVRGDEAAYAERVGDRLVEPREGVALYALVAGLIELDDPLYAPFRESVQIEVYDSSVFLNRLRDHEIEYASPFSGRRYRAYDSPTVDATGRLQESTGFRLIRDANAALAEYERLSALGDEAPPNALSSAASALHRHESGLDLIVAVLRALAPTSP